MRKGESSPSSWKHMQTNGTLTHSIPATSYIEPFPVWPDNFVEHSQNDAYGSNQPPCQSHH